MRIGRIGSNLGGRMYICKAILSIAVSLGAMHSASAAEILPNRMGAGASTCEALVKLDAFQVSDNSMQWSVGFIVGRAWADEQKSIVRGIKSDFAENVNNKTDLDIVNDLKQICKAKPDKRAFFATISKLCDYPCEPVSLV